MVTTHHRRRRQLRLINIQIIIRKTPSHSLQLSHEEIPLLLHHRRPLITTHLVLVPPQMPPVRQAAQRLLERQGLFDLGVDVGAGEPVVAELRAAVEVDGGDNAHVALAPFAAAVGDLGFEEFEGVETEVRVGDFEALAEDGAGLVLDEEEASVCFVAGDLLHDVQVVDGGEEVAE